MGNLNNVILCGGSGRRLWPLSRPKYPKQFVKVFNGKSLFQLTVERNSKLVDSYTIVAAEDMLYHALNQLEELSIFKEKKFHFLCEPIAKNTFPAILLACFHAKNGETVFITPSDHAIDKLDEYEFCIAQGFKLSQEGKINTFGLKPLSAHTGYGYIEAEGNKILSFNEKPKKEIAEKYLEQGNYLWNSGMFLAKKETILLEASNLDSEMYNSVEAVYETRNTENCITTFNKQVMDRVRSESIDYGLMEKTTKGSVVECNITWNDLGSFESLANYLKGSEQNILHNESKNSFFFTDKKVVSFGLENVIAVEDSDTLFIGNINDSEKVKEIYSEIKLKREEELHTSGMDHRPWGAYYNLIDEENYKVKKIEIFPGKCLSLQKHYHRSEHWVVVEGSPTVTIGEVDKIYNVGEHIYINQEEVHRLENNTKFKVIIIEIQFGSYLGEDEIERLDDAYGRI